MGYQVKFSFTGHYRHHKYRMKYMKNKNSDDLKIFLTSWIFF